MAGGYIQVPPDSIGKKLNARYRAIEGTAGYEQYVALQGLPTFYCLARSISLAQNKHLFSIYNDTGSGYLIRVPRLSIVNMSLTSVSGVGVELDFMRTTSQSGGTVITPQKADTADVNLTATIHIATGATIAEGALLWPVTLNNDEIPLTLNATPLLDFNMIPRGMDVKPLCIRPGEGFSIKQITNTSVGLWSILAVITAEDIT
jgi:hypothetical protein